MKVGALREVAEGEARVAVTPSSAAHLKKLGHEVLVESGAGARSGFSDDDYRAAGVEVLPSAAALTDAAPDALRSEVRFPPAREGHGMVGSGMFVVNPPFGLAEEAARLERHFSVLGAGAAP